MCQIISQIGLIFLLSGCTNPNTDGTWGLMDKDGVLTGAESTPEEIYNSEDPLDNTGLPSMTSEMDSEFCTNAWQNSPNVAGAVSYFSGIYLRAENGFDWMGREHWVLFPNSEWTEDFSKCTVTWQISAVPIEPNLCVACEEAIEVFAEIDVSSTTCPEDVWNFPEERSWSTKYDLLLSGNDAVFFYHDSGARLGSGDSNSYAASFLSDPHCLWF
ncbi:MAG: hypothetical protein CMK59_11870 [Proteobacteria bacterium]|nr:hypothetical protein [Pseudomonadota bacterium]